jgi:glucose-1-phosphate adenylyltransferase
VFAFRFDGYWRDVGTLKSYMDSNMDLLDPDSGLDIQHFKVRTNVEAYYPGDHPPVKLGRNALVKNALISAGTEVEGRVSHSIISPRVHVGAGSVIRDSIVMEGTCIGKDCTIDSCIVDKNAVIEDGSIIGEGDPSKINVKYPKVANTGITVIGKGARLPAGIKVGRNVIIWTDVRPDDFKGDVPDGGTIEPDRAER